MSNHITFGTPPIGTRQLYQLVYSSLRTASQRGAWHLVIEERDNCLTHGVFIDPVANVIVVAAYNSLLALQSASVIAVFAGKET